MTDSAAREPGLEPGAENGISPAAGSATVKRPNPAGHTSPCPPRTHKVGQNGTTFCDPGQRRYVLIAAILASALGFIDGSVVSIAIPAIRESLDASLTDAQWISNAYMLTLSALILVGGAFGDRFGLRKVFASGIALFILASLVCAVAPNAPFLIAARTIQGIAAAMMVPGSLAIISKAYPRAERGRAIGIWAAASAITTAAGPIVGGALLSLGNDEYWRLIFALNLPLGGFALWLLLFRVPADAPGGGRRLDLLGSFLITGVLALAALALTGGEGEGSLPGLSRMLRYGLPALAALVLFIGWERRFAAPIVPLGLFAIRAFSAANIVTFALYFALSAILFYLPMTLIAGWGVTAAETGFLFLPFTVFIGALSSTFGAMAEKYGAHLFVALGSLVVAAAYAVLALGMPYQSFWWHVLPSMCLIGFGMALIVSPLSTVVMASAGDAMSGTASGINNSVSRVAGLFAVALMGGVAAAVYAGAEGPGSFGAPMEGSVESAATAHTAASNAAFMAIAWSVAVISLISAAIAYFGMRERREPASQPAE